MRVILDTNVVMSGVFFGGLPEQILLAWQEQRLKLVVSPEILAEYIRVAKYLSSSYAGIDIDEILALIAAHAEVCNAPRLPKPVCSDPNDDMFLACAIKAGVTAIVSGDKGLKATSGYKGISVLSPREFCSRYLRD